MSVRRDSLGDSSVVRALLSLTPPCHDSLLNALHSTGIDLSVLRARWSALTLRLFAAQLWRVNGPPVLLADGRKITGSGRKMPAVKHLHQESGNNKPAFIMGHSTRTISLLVNAEVNGTSSSRSGSWMRTIRRGMPASERVVSTALQNTLDEFLAAGHQCCNMAKFIFENQTTMGREDVSVAV